METLNERIKNLRKEKGLTQGQLADKLGITDKAVSKWEVGEANPDIALLPKLAEIFGVTLDYLLTGTAPEKEVLIISPKEMLIKTDDPKYLDKISEHDLNFGDIFKNKLVRTFAYLVDNGKIGHYFRGGRYNNYNGYIKEILLLSLLSNRLDKLKVFSFNDIGYADEKEWTDEMTEAFVSGETVTDETREYVLTIHERQPIGAGKPYPGAKSDMYRHGNWQLLYPRLLTGFAKAGKWDWVSRILSTFDELNGPMVEKYNETKGTRYGNGATHFLMFKPANDYADNWDRYGYQVVAVPPQVLNMLLEAKQYDLLDRANAINAAVEKETIGKKTIDMAKLKDDDSIGGDERFERECVYKHIINPGVLSKSRNPKLVRKILDGNYLHYYEYVYDLVSNGRIKEAFEFLIDNGYDDIAAFLLPKKGETFYPRALKLCFTAFTARKGYQWYEGHEELLANQNRLGIEEDDEEVRARSRGQRTLRMDFIKEHGDIFECAGQLDDNPIIALIKQKKEAIYQGVLGAIAQEETRKREQAEREKIAKGLTREYFEGLLAQGKPESIKLFKLELCALLDAIFLYDYHYAGADFSERMNSHFRTLEDAAPKEREMDDGWGYMVPDEKYTEEVVIPERNRIAHLRDIFYRLRVSRNNIVHPEKATVAELSKAELEECLAYVFGINRGK